MFKNKISLIKNTGFGKIILNKYLFFLYNEGAFIVLNNIKFNQIFIKKLLEFFEQFKNKYGIKYD